MSASVLDPATRCEAPLTLAEAPTTRLGLPDTLGLWGNLGISLLLPVAAAFVVLAGRPLALTVLAIVVGAVIGALLLGLTAATSAAERVPAMVLLRGLLGRRASAVSSQNLAARLDRRVLAVAVGTVATLLALSFDIASYEPFLFLLGAVFVPLAGVLIVAYYLVPRGSWDVSDTAPGTHLGPADLPLRAARRVVGADHLLGGSVREPVRAGELVAEGADYLGVGPAYATATRAGLPAPLRAAGVGAVASVVQPPVIAIGGVTAARVPELLAAGAYGVAVVGAVSGAADPAAAVRELLRALEAAP